MSPAKMTYPSGKERILQVNEEVDFSQNPFIMLTSTKEGFEVFTAASRPSDGNHTDKYGQYSRRMFAHEGFLFEVATPEEIQNSSS